MPKALLASNITPAAIFRVIEAEQPTLLIDELDSFSDAHEELRGILNSGHRRAGAKVIRTVGDTHEPREFSTWSPMVFAAIGRLPGTLEDRSIIIPMQRRAPGESVSPLRWSGRHGDALRGTLAVLARGIVRWVSDHADDLLECEPTVPVCPPARDRAKAAITNEDETVLERLISLPALEYGRLRKDEAQRLRVPVGILDREIKDRQKQLVSAANENGRLHLVKFGPASEPIDGQQLMTCLTTTIQKYVVMSAHALDAVALWAIRAHAHDLFDVNPRLVLRSPEKRCGKTTLLEVLEHVVPKALLASNITPSAIFRVIEAEEPTLLIDELDSFLDAHEELLARPV